MRQIKFKAWDKKRKRMYIVLSLHTATVMNGGIWATVEGWDVIEDKNIHIQVQPKDIEVMQFTGLKDKNGKEIFEGDEFIHGKSRGFIVYKGDSFKIEWYHNADFWNEHLRNHAGAGEVTGGHVYDTPCEVKP